MTTDPFRTDNLASRYASVLDLGTDQGAEGVEGAGAILHDMEEEMLNAAYLVQSLHDKGLSESGEKMDENMMKTIQDASKGVTEGTDAEYRRLMNSCEMFLHEKKLLSEGIPFFSATPHQDAAYFIVAWILDKCDEVNLDGKPKGVKVERQSYMYAQKMRAAATYGFGRIHHLGNAPWRQSEVTGKWVGNPSVSETVSTYMVSLRRRKVRAGETPTSAKAITVEQLQALYEYNTQPQFFDLKDYDRNNPPPADGWKCGARKRRLLNLAYAIAFTCLLRIDEVLRIEHRHIQIRSDRASLALTLDYRKTSQFGHIEPFILHKMPPEMAHLCVVQRYADWLEATDIADGYVFRKMDGYDKVVHTNEPMTSEYFLEMFRNNLLDINVDPTDYGTHSFRRGGCQWLSVHLRWGIRQICEWGGWSMEFSNLTIVKYLISWNDNPMLKREDFFNFNRPPSTKCFTCGRSCHCA